MHQAIDDFPERDECKLKLLEIFYANENKSAFEEYATELVDSGKNSDVEFWSKVIEMGAELDPDSTLYNESVKGEAVFKSTESEQGSIAGNTIASTKTAGNNNEPEFDLSVFDEDDEFEIETGEKVAEETGLDFDLSVFDVDETSAENIGEDTTEITTDELETIKFETSVENSDDLPVEEDLKVDNASESDDIESFEFDLGTATKVDIDADDAIDLSTQSEIEEELESFDFSLDSSAIETSDTKPEEKTTNSIEALDDLADGVSDLTDMDEVETKIDLAKAYIDMGDNDAAKKIAEEVMEKGSVKQKKAAEAIIEQLK
jgi:pilus assembly protein FimV